MIILLKKYRYDYFLIWGHGTRYLDDILNIIRQNSDYTILKMIKHRSKNIKKLIKAIYSYDYAPFQHLKAKTKYLLTTPNKVVFIFIKNNNVKESFSGEGQFRHIECSNIISTKENIRNQFNERKEDRRSENHIIHASDNELQTDYIMKYLGYKNGVKIFHNMSTSLLPFPHHLGEHSKFILKLVNIDQLFCNIIKGNQKYPSMELSLIEQTPHFACLNGDIKLYKNYLDKYSGNLLQDDYSVTKLINLSKIFTYLKYPYTNNYIITREIKTNKYQILDGVHRACILKNNGTKKIIIAVVK